MSNRIRIRRDTAAAWASANPVLGLGEMGLETDTRKTKFGDGLSAWNSLSYSVDKSQIGLSNVDNTSDANKPISSATQTALDLKANSADVYTKAESNSNYEPKSASIQAHIIDQSNPHSVTKAQVGLSNVDNTSDANKPISTDTQTALDLKADSSSVYTIAQSDLNFEPKNTNIQSHISNTNNPHSTTKAQVGLGNVDNTSDVNKPISTATQSALDLKANSANVYTKTEVDDISTNTLQFANSYTDTKVASIVNSAPVTLDTLNELAAALGNDPNFATTTATLIGTKANSSDVYTKTQSDSNFEPKNANIQSHISSTSNPHSVTKAQVGLGDVDNVSAANLRDRSTHTGTQLASTISDFTTAVQSVNIDATNIAGGLISNAEFGTLFEINTATTIQLQLDGKEPSITAGTSSEYYRGDKTFQTLDKTAVGLSDVDNVSAIDLRDRATHTGNETTLSWNETATPSVPSVGVSTYSKAVGGRQMFAQIGKSGVDYSFQPFIARNRILLHQANGAATTITSWGAAAPSATGTATARNSATTNAFTWMRRVGYVSAATAGSTAGLRSTVLQFGTGNGARLGGFHFVIRFGISDAAIVAGARTMVGLTATTTAFTNAEPSTFLNLIGMGHDSTDTNFQIMFNDGAGAATKIDLGANFSKSVTNTNMYELALYCAPNGTTVYYQAINLTSDTSTSGTITTNIPLNTQLLTWQLWRSNNATAAAVGIDLCSVYIETDN